MRYAEIGGGTGSSIGGPDTSDFAVLLISFVAAEPKPEIDFSKVPDFAVLLISFVVWCVAFFLLYDASRFEKWQLAGEAHVPNPLAGITLAWIVSLSVLALWVRYVMFLVRPREPVWISLLFGEPRYLVPGLLIAALLPAAVAVFKYLRTALAVRTQAGIPGRRLGGLAGALVALITLGASIATLVMFWDYLFGPRP